MVCAAFRDGRGEFDILFRARTENGGTLVRGDTGRFHVRRKVTPTVLIPLNTGKIVAPGFTKARRDKRQGKREVDAGFTGSAAQKFSALNVDFPRCGQAWRLTSATLAGVFAAKTSTKRTPAVNRNVERLRSCDRVSKPQLGSRRSVGIDN